ncbi:MAG: PQQ-binding-like beta-propeller repeat protein [Phycisphaerales bacterium]|nr:PQQ-binding-like beta-propeller repeat protein [Phycisphaerales bacterium]
MNNRMAHSYRAIAAAALFGCVATTVNAEPLAKAKKGDWRMWGGSADRNMVSGETGIAAEWDLKAKKNIKWAVELGSQTYGNPVVINGKVLAGTNNNGHLRPGIEGDKGVIVCVDEKTGKFLWQMTHDKLPTGRVNDWPEQGICSTPYAEGDRIWYVSNRCELVCADLEGFLDGENDGPFKDEKYHDEHDGDIVWKYDMIEELGVFPHNLATSSPVGYGDLIFINTSNGVDEGHLDMPVASAPAFIAVNKKTGELVWENNQPGDKVLHGSWSSPAVGMVAGKPQVVFAGGDGYAYSFEPESGKLIWKFNLNPKDSKWELGGRGTKNNIIATPVIHEDRVYLCVGQDPEHGEGPGHLYSIDATKTGDITKSGLVWHVGGDRFNRSMSTVAIADGLLYISDLSGFLYCLDLKTGKEHWKYDTYAAIWGSPYVVDGKVYLGDEDGEVVVLKHGPKLEEIATNDMLNSVYTSPVAANGTLFVTNRRMMVAIELPKDGEKKPAADADGKPKSDG